MKNNLYLHFYENKYKIEIKFNKNPIYIYTVILDFSSNQIHRKKYLFVSHRDNQQYNSIAPVVRVELTIAGINVFFSSLFGLCVCFTRASNTLLKSKKILRLKSENISGNCVQPVVDVGVILWVSPIKCASFLITRSP